MRGLLEREGFAVAEAGNGREALDRLRDGSRTDLILLDLLMPEMDGWLFRREQRADPTLAGIPVVVVSAVAADRIIARELAPAGLLTKPVEAEELVGAVREYC
jgi:two-component system response regulator MprA